MVNLRGWIRRAEAASREASGEVVLVDERDGRTHHVPKDAFSLVLVAAVGEEPDPAIKAILPTEDDPDKLERLYYSNGELFWLTDMTQTGKAAANSVGGED
jgi:hypothetical protein